MKIDSCKDRESVVFDFIRFPLILLVVYIHILSSQSVFVSFEVSWNNVYNWVSSLISHNIGTVAVPCFFVISGYFYFVKMKIWNTDFYIKQQKNRLKTLVVPYIIMNTIEVLVALIKGLLYNKIGGGDCGLDDLAVINENSLFDLYIGIPIDYPLWYLRDLIVMTFLSFLFYYLFRYLNRYGLIVLFVLYYSPYSLSISGFSSTAILFFGIGSYFGIYKKSIINLSDKLWKVSMPISIILVLLATYFDTSGSTHDTLVSLFVPFGVISAFAIANRLHTINLLKDMSYRCRKYVFFIYSVHAIYLINWVKGAFYRTPLVNYGWGMIILYFVMPIVVVLVCIIIYEIMERLTPRTLGLICGSRSKNNMEVKTSKA